MDVGTDFLQPEFLNILFFQQKNLVIFPYIDLKHLHALEIFTVGHNVINVESTALYNLREIIEGETINAYSQNPNLFIIYNLDDEKLKELMEINDIRCILNVNEKTSSLANGDRFIFYNKKTMTFLNHDFKDSDLEFERFLIKTSKNQEILSDTIQKIKSSATRIFKEYVETGEINSLSLILHDYPPQYWKKILKFVEIYFEIILPDINIKEFIEDRSFGKKSNGLTSYSLEYELIITQNRDIAKEFTHVLHDYRSRKVNPANLELEQLFNPQKLFDYLRNNHWKKGLSKDFLEQWTQMKFTNTNLTDDLKEEFLELFIKLNIPMDHVKELLHLDQISKNGSLPSENHENSIAIENTNAIKDFLELSNSFSNVLGNIEECIFGKLIFHEKKPNNYRISDFQKFKLRFLGIIKEIDQQLK